MRYRDTATGLVVRGEAIEYVDFPAIEWVIGLENTGAADTPILADIQPLDTRFAVDPERSCWVHHARGSQFCLEDFEPFATPLMLTEADPPDRVGMSEIRHIEGLYAFWDEVLARHPGLVIDNCSSGGRRIDLESISRGITFTRSDLNDWPHDDDHVVAMQTLTHGLSLWYSVSFACTRGMDIYKMRSALGPGIAMRWSYAAVINHQDVPMDVLRPRLDELASVREYFYGDYYPLLPFSLTREAWDGWQFDRPDLGSGIVQLFRRDNSPIESARLKLHGLDPAAPYEVTHADTSRPVKMTGQVLTIDGGYVMDGSLPGAEYWTE